MASTFKRDDHETPVIFRAVKRGTFEGDVTAVFPTEPHDCTDGYVCVVAHMAAGTCSREWFNATRPATPAEYADLKRELESAPYGYRLKVYQRITSRHRDTFNAEVRRIYSRESGK